MPVFLSSLLEVLLLREVRAQRGEMVPAQRGGPGATPDFGRQRERMFKGKGADFGTFASTFQIVSIVFGWC